MATATKQIALPFPSKGVNQGWPKNAQPQLTTPDALNVITYEPNSDRARGGQRWGVSKAHASALAGGGGINRIMGMHAVAYQVADTVSAGEGGEGVEEVLLNKFFIAADGSDVEDDEIDTLAQVLDGEDFDGVAGSGAMNEGNVPGGGGSVAFAVATWDHVDGSNPAVRWFDSGETLEAYAAFAWVNDSEHYIPESEPTNTYQADNYRITATFRGRVGSGSSFSAGGCIVLANMDAGITQQNAIDSAPATPANCLIAFLQPSGGGDWLLASSAITTTGDGSGDSATIDSADMSDTLVVLVQIERHGADVTARAINSSTSATIAEVTYELTSGEIDDLDNAAQLSGFGLLPGVDPSLPPNPGVSNFKVELVTEGSASPIVEATRQLRMVAQANRSVYVGSLGGSWTNVINATTGSKPSMCDINGKVYYVNGTDTLVIDPYNVTGTTMASTAGTLPTGCRIAVNWRSRLVLSQQDANPQNVYMSRAGVPTDFDYNPGVPDALQAVALNASSSAGRIGQPVKALIPFRDDVLLIGCDHSLFSLVGDPADGGVITTISDSLGILQRDGWTIAPNGAVYFVGSGGFWEMAGPTATPKNLALGVYEQFFTGLDRKGNYIQCQWDRDAEGCWIFVTKIETGESTHLWWDAKLRAFWPQRFPDVQGPLASYLYDGDLPADRFILLGGRDGYIRKIDPTALDDDGSTISSHVFIGPFNPYGPFGKAKLLELEGVTGEGTTNLVYEIRTGDDAKAALEAAYDYQLAWSTAGRQAKTRQRARGNTFVLKLTNVMPDNRWSFERVAAWFEPSGKMR